VIGRTDVWVFDDANNGDLLPTGTKLPSMPWASADSRRENR
jgi:hypothetical protein